MAKREVQILMGSDSDAPIMQRAVDMLREFGITCDMTVASAHRSPERVHRLVDEANADGVKVFIVGAGAAAHLAGVVAALSIIPVIGVPIDSSPLKGWDSLLATVQMPKGVPVATMAVGKAGAINAAILCAEILSLSDKSIEKKLDEFKKRRDVIVNGLNSIPGIECPMPGGAFYVFPSIEGTGMSSKQFANDLLEKHGVACLAGESFGEYGKGCIRFSFANSMENLNEALDRINSFVIANS